MSSILDCLDIQTGDEVLVSNYTMIATANAPRLVNGKTVLVDISRENLCMCPQDLKKKLLKIKILYLYFNKWKDWAHK